MKWGVSGQLCWTEIRKGLNNTESKKIIMERNYKQMLKST
nr:MAG TPA: hypothetical protein [Caudoviricetes sp.]